MKEDAAQFHHRQIISRRFVATRSIATLCYQANKALFNDVAIAIRIAIKLRTSIRCHFLI